MESGDSFDDIPNFFSTPIDEGLPALSPTIDEKFLENFDKHLDLVPPLPIDVGLPPASSTPPQSAAAVELRGRELPVAPPSAVAVELQGWELPALSSTHTDVELLEKHLVPAIDRLRLSKGLPVTNPWELPALRMLASRPTVVNAGLPAMNPWDLPGIKEGRREKYYLTDRHDLCFTDLSSPYLEAPDGLWKRRDWAWTFPGGSGTRGHKKTYEFHGRGPSGVGVGSKTNWIMNVYSLIAWDRFIEDGLVLCHVFEEDSPDYDARPKCSAILNYGCSPVHHGPDWRSNPRLTSYMADLENLLYSDLDTSTDTDNCNPRRGIPPIADDRHSKKRKKKSSDVWEFFTKIFARDRDGNVLTFAACNHCFKVLTGGSKGGTSHLGRHKCSCPCKLQPVAAGRKAQGDVNVLSS